MKSAFWQSFFAYDQATTYNAVLWTMENEFYGSVFLFAFLGLLGHRRSRFFTYPLIVLVNFAFQLHWLNAFVAGIALCDLFVNRDRLSPIQSALGWSVWRGVREKGVVASGLWSMVIVAVGLGNYWQITYLLVGTAAVALTLVSRPTQRPLSSGVPVFLGRIFFPST